VRVTGTSNRLDDLRRTGVLVLEASAAEIAADPSVVVLPYSAALSESVGRPCPELRILRSPGGIGARYGVDVI